MDFWIIGGTYKIVLKNGDIRTMTIQGTDGPLIFGTDKNGQRRSINKDEISEARNLGDAYGSGKINPDKD